MENPSFRGIRGKFSRRVRTGDRDFSRRCADYRGQSEGRIGTRFARKDYAEAGGIVTLSQVVYLPRIPRREGFLTDYASASPQDYTNYTDYTNSGCCKSNKNNLRNPSAQSASVELESAKISASARNNPYNSENQNNPWKIRPSVESVGNSSAELKQWIEIFSRRSAD